MVNDRLRDNVENAESLGGRLVGSLATYFVYKAFEFSRFRNSGLSQEDKRRSGAVKTVALGSRRRDEGAFLHFTGVH